MIEYHLPFRYIAKKMGDIDYNYELKKKLIILAKTKKVDNIIFYGLNGSSKYIFMKCYLNLIYNNNNLIYNNTIEKFKLSNKFEVTYCKNNYTYEFFDTGNITNNYLIVKEIIYKLCYNNTIDNSVKVFIINNIYKFNLYNNKIISNLITKFNNIKIIGLNDRYIDIPNFLLLRCRCLNNFELYKIIHYVNLNENMNLNYNEELEILGESEYNLNFLFELLNKKKYNIPYINYFENIVDLILTKDLEKYIIIKNILQNLFIINEHSIETILYKIFKIFIKKTTLDNKTQFYLLNEISNININCSNKFNITDCLIFLLYKIII
jgi:hypothetical protein